MEFVKNNDPRSLFGAVELQYGKDNLAIKNRLQRYAQFMTTSKRESKLIEPIFNVALDNKKYFRKNLIYASDTADLYIRGAHTYYQDTDDYCCLRTWYEYGYGIKISGSFMSVYCIMK